MDLSKIKLDNISLDFKTVMLLIAITATWYDQKGDNKVRDRDHKDFEKRITRLEGFHEPKLVSSVATYNKVAVLAERIQTRGKNKWEK